MNMGLCGFCIVMWYVCVIVVGMFCVCVGLMFYFMYGFGSLVVCVVLRNGLNGRIVCVCWFVVMISGVWFLNVVNRLFIVLLIFVVECRLMIVVLLVVCVWLLVILIMMVLCRLSM